MVASVTSFDPDGPTGNPPRLVIAGFFSSVNGVAATNVATYNGSTWAPIPGLTPQSPVGALTVHDFDADGPALPELVIPTRATLLGLTTDLVAWNGSMVRRAANGTFNQIGMLSYPHNAASFNIPGGFSGLLTFGQFSSFAGSPVANVASLNASSLSQLSSSPGSGFDNFYIDSIVAVDLDGNGPEPASLFASGPDLSSNANPMPTVARWNGSNWMPLSAAFELGTNIARIDSITVIDAPSPENSQTYLQGSFRTFGGVPGFNTIARSNATGLSNMGNGLSEVSAGTASVINFDPDADGPLPPKLYASGSYINSWNGSQWVREPSPFSILARRMCIHDFDGPGPNPPRLIATGNASSLGKVVQFDGSTWSQIGGGIGFDSVGGVATDVLSFDHDADGPQLPILYAVGNIRSAGDIPLNNAAFFDGNAWQPMALGAINPRGLTLFDTDGDGPRPVEVLIYGGGSSEAPPGLGNRISAWDGSTWRTLGQLNGATNALTAFDPDGDGPQPSTLIAAGFFTASGDTQLPLGLAQWNTLTQDWEPFQAETPFQFHYALGVERPWGAGGPQRLVLSGYFPPIDNFDAPDAAVIRFTNLGPAWCLIPPSDLSIEPGQTIELSAQLHPAYAHEGAQYTWLRNGQPVSNGAEGAAPGGGFVSSASGFLSPFNLTATLRISDATTFDAGAYSLRLTNPAGQSTSIPAAVSVGSPCPADFNADGFLDFFDYDDFVSCFEGACPNGLSADFNADGFADFFDFDDFIAAFEAGC